MAPQLHFAENTFALQLFLQGFQRLIYIIVTYEYLHSIILKSCYRMDEEAALAMRYVPSHMLLTIDPIKMATILLGKSINSQELSPSINSPIQVIKKD